MAARPLATLVALTLLSGCASPVATPPAQSEAFTAPIARFAGYRAVWIEAVALDAESPQPAGLGAAYRAELTRALAARNYLVLASAPSAPADVLRIRASITGEQPSATAEVLDATTGERLASLASQPTAPPALCCRPQGQARAALARQARDLAAQLPRRPRNWADAG